jgi:TolB-like protein/Tfp pilus assembly protein PilF
MEVVPVLDLLRFERFVAVFRVTARCARQNSRHFSASPTFFAMAVALSLWKDGSTIRSTRSIVKGQIAVSPTNLFAELKRRNVYKVVVAYAIAAWLLIQIATQLFPFFEIPNWAVRLVVALLLFGLPVAIVFAWIFELTPEGLKRTEGVPPKDFITQGTDRKLDFAIIGTLLAVIGALVFSRLHSSRTEHVSVAPQKSIAVLPFKNLSRDAGNAYFAEGVQEEILGRLSKLAQLKVISRTSTQRYKSSSENLRQIAQQLGVANILEGSVQKEDEQVRVHVQLINANTDEHLWAESYDRDLTDVFAVESEIAKKISDVLHAKLTGSEQKMLDIRPTESTEAHQLYLKGRYFWNKRTGDDLQLAISYFNQAIEKDQKYALAYAGLADAYVLLPQYTAGAPKDCIPKAKAAAQKALELDETLAEAHACLAESYITYDLDVSKSVKEFKRAIQLNPNYATAHQWYGYIALVVQGRFDEAIAEIKRALELDPLSLIINADLGAAYVSARRPDDAIDQLRRTLQLDPGFYYAHWNLGTALELNGSVESAITEYQKGRELNDDPYILGLLGHAYALSGRKDQALQILDQLAELSKERYVGAYSFAIVHLGLGDKEQALRWLEQSYRDRAGSDIGFIKVDPALDPLRGDPRFEKLVATVFSSTKTEARMDNESQ